MYVRTNVVPAGTVAVEDSKDREVFASHQREVILIRRLGLQSLLARKSKAIAPLLLVHTRRLRSNLNKKKNRQRERQKNRERERSAALRERGKREEEKMKKIKIKKKKKERARKTRQK